MHFAVSSYAPVISDQGDWRRDLSVKGITREAFQPESVIVKCKMNEGKYIGRVAFYRRPELSWEDVSQASAEVKDDPWIQWVDSVPTGVSLGS
jgi:hypothetical protein